MKQAVDKPVGSLKQQILATFFCVRFVCKKFEFMTVMYVPRLTTP
jgi:hypothetical protein